MRQVIVEKDWQNFMSSPGQTETFHALEERSGKKEVPNG